MDFDIFLTEYPVCPIKFTVCITFISKCVQSLYNTPHYTMDLYHGFGYNKSMLWFPIFLPWNFTNELLVNDQITVIFLLFLCKIVPL